MKIGYTNFAVGNILSALKRGIITSRKEILVGKTKSATAILSLFYRKGFIEGFELVSPSVYKVHLKYWNGQALIKNFRIISKPSKRVHLSVLAIKKRLMSGKLSVFSTSRGLLTSVECLYLNIGGEILFEIIL